ncbi:NAD(P)-dependent oxidoreductase [Alsobacter sp. KACC 23698]|uniref:NAD(P)-dependent oxidoreductase n=1 Tax=Alsobacter sp. KACC 23698 TaxID=3149229 RepID=A0AAU7JCZ7_9HYPH
MIVGFVGLGAMGLPMAQNLVRRQFRVRGFDMRAEALQALEKAGGAAAASAREAADGADALVLMVVNAAQAESVLFEAGALDALGPQATVILMATCPPAAASAIAARVAATGRRFVDAPVSGGVVGATAGTLTIMAAAPQDVFDAAKPVLEALGDKIFHVGLEPGQGATVKTVNQLMCGVHIAVAAEAMALAEKAGIDGAIVLEILGGSAASSWMLKDRGPRMLEDEPRVTSAVDIFVKDLGIVLDAGRASKTPTPLAALAHQLFVSASAQGLGLKDDSQVVSVYRALAGSKPN